MPVLAIVSRAPLDLPRGWAGVIFDRPTREWCAVRPALELRGNVLLAQLDGPPLARDGWSFGHGGGTNAELFAYLLSRLHAAGVTASSSDSAIDAVLRDATAELVSARSGALDFVLSNGALLYAHRAGPPLYLTRRPGEIRIASEPLTDERWVTLEEGALIRCRTGADAVVVALRGADPIPASPSSRPELPFTD